MVTPYESYVEVCEKLNELTPGDHEKRTFLVNTGAEAVENAVKVARHATGRPGGRRVRPRLPRPHAADDDADGQEHAVQAGFGPFAPEVYRVPLAYPFRWPTGPENCAEEAAAQAIDMITSRSARRTSPPW